MKATVHSPPRVAAILPRSSVMFAPYSASTMDTLGGGVVREAPSSAKRASLARWDRGGLQEHTAVAGPDGRGFGEAGHGRLGRRQDLRARKGWVRGGGAPGRLAQGCSCCKLSWDSPTSSSCRRLWNSGSASNSFSRLVDSIRSSCTSQYT